VLHFDTYFIFYRRIFISAISISLTINIFSLYLPVNPFCQSVFIMDGFLNYILVLFLTNGGNPGLNGSLAFTKGEPQLSSPFGYTIIYTSEYL